MVFQIPKGATKGKLNCSDGAAFVHISGKKNMYFINKLINIISDIYIYKLLLRMVHHKHVQNKKRGKIYYTVGFLLGLSGYKRGENVLC